MKKAIAAGQIRLHGILRPFAEQPGKLSALIDALYTSPWVVYAKPPFGGPTAVVKYLGRYTHRIAISNALLVSLTNCRVCFQWKDYRAGNTSRVMALTIEEFIRRFFLHVLPRGFVRIRYFGFLANATRAAKLQLCRDQTQPDKAVADPNTGDGAEEEELGPLPRPSYPCPLCVTGRMVWFMDLPRRARETVFLSAEADSMHLPDPGGGIANPA